MIAVIIISIIIVYLIIYTLSKKYTIVFESRNGNINKSISFINKCKPDHCNSKELIYIQYGEGESLFAMRSAWCKKCGMHLVGIRSDGGLGDWVYIRVKETELEPEVLIAVNKWKSQRIREKKLKRIARS